MGFFTILIAVMISRVYACTRTYKLLMCTPHYTSIIPQKELCVRENKTLFSAILVAKGSQRGGCGELSDPDLHLQSIS